MSIKDFFVRHMRVIKTIVLVIALVVIVVLSVILYYNWQETIKYENERIEKARQDSIRAVTDLKISQQLIGNWERIPSGSVYDDDEDGIKYIVFDKYNKTKFIRNNQFYKIHNYKFEYGLLYIYDHHMRRNNAYECKIYDKNGVTYLTICGSNSEGLYKKTQYKPSGSIKLN